MTDDEVLFHLRKPTANWPVEVDRSLYSWFSSSPVEKYDVINSFYVGGLMVVMTLLPSGKHDILYVKTFHTERYLIEHLL